MGDRANFGFVQHGEQGDSTVFLYAHWGGYQMMDTLANALYVVLKEGRANDPAYATRIAISQIIGDDWNQGLGYGITVNEVADNEHSVPVVDWEKGTVTLYSADFDAIKFTMPIGIFVGKFLKNIPEPLDTRLLVG